MCVHIACKSSLISSSLLQLKQREFVNVKGVSLLFMMNLKLLEYGCQIMIPLALPWHGHLEIFVLKILV